jgi:hypothetical protein
MVKMFWLSGTADYFETDYHITKLLNILIQSNLFKRSNFQVISQFIHVKDISKVNDNGNQYKQRLILYGKFCNISFLINFIRSVELNGNREHEKFHETF